MFDSTLYFYATINVHILENINLSLQLFFYFRGYIARLFERAKEIQFAIKE